MKLTKQRQACLAVLGLGLAGLAIDRAMLSPVAANASAEPTIEAAVALASEAAPAGAPTRQTLANRLREVEGAHGLNWTGGRVRDAFRAADAWRDELRQTAPGEPDLAFAAGDLFRQKYQLHAVVTGPSAGLARLTHAGGEQLMKVGGVVDGIELIALNARTATFRPAGGGEEFRLELPKSQLKPNGEVGAAPESGGSGGF